MDTPETNKFHRVGEEWRGIPCPNDAVKFCQKMEMERDTARKAEARAIQTVSIARQTIKELLVKIERLEKLSAGGGTVDQASTKLLSAPGGNLWHEISTILSYWQKLSDPCQCSSGKPIGACLRCDMETLEDRVAELLFIESKISP